MCLLACGAYTHKTCVQTFVTASFEVIVIVLRAIDGFARSIDCAAPSMDPLIAHLSVDCAPIGR